MQERLPGATSTWRPTRPSSCRTTTRGGCGRASRVRDGLHSPVGAAGRARARAGQRGRRTRPACRRARQAARRRGAAARRCPRFADQTFSRLVRRAVGDTPRRPGSDDRVILWPDTFNNHFHPDTAIAATEVLEAAGCEVVVPAGRCAAAGRSTTTACSTQAKAHCLRDVLARPARAHRRRHADRRARAELPRGVSRRARQPVSRRRGREAPVARRHFC